MTKARVLLLDDHKMFRQTVARFLSAEPGIELKLHTGSVGEALLIVAAGLVDLVILDVELGPERGIDFLAQARRNGFVGPVLVLTAGVSSEQQESLERLGISELVRKDASVERLADCVRRAAGGPPALVPQPCNDETPGGDLLRPFTPREAGVLRLVVEGLLNKEIAGELDTSEAAVKSIVQQLLHKTGARTRTQLVRFALEQYRDEM